MESHERRHFLLLIRYKKQKNKRELYLRIKLDKIILLVKKIKTYLRTPDRSNKLPNHRKFFSQIFLSMFILNMLSALLCTHKLIIFLQKFLMIFSSFIQNVCHIMSYYGFKNFTVIRVKIKQ